MREQLNKDVLPNLQPENVFNRYDHKFKKSGREWRGDCPNHYSKSGTSFSVTPEKWLWNCSGCGVGGSVLEYMKFMEDGTTDLSPADVKAYAKELYAEADVRMPKPRDGAEIYRADARWLFYQADLYRFHRVSKSYLKRRSAVVEYLRGRGLKASDIAEFGLGFVPPSRLRYRIDGPFLREHDYGDYVSIPWYDARGNLLTIYLAYIGDRSQNSSSHKVCLPNLKDARGEAIVKGKSVPFFFDRAKHNKHLVLVEGVFDVMVAHAKGDDRVIGCVAAQLSAEQINTLLKHKVETLTIALDPDRAGEKGIESCVTNIQEACKKCKSSIKILIAPQLPSDPDDFILNKGIGVWKRHLNQAISVEHWLFDRLFADITPSSRAEDKDNAISKIAPYLPKGESTRDEMISRIHDVTGVKIRSIQKQLKNGVTKAKFDDFEGLWNYALENGEQRAVDINEITKTLLERTGGWPKRVDSQLFVDEGGDKVRFLDKQHELFAYLQSDVKKVSWNESQITGGSSLVTKIEFFSHLKARLKNHNAIELLPHVPPFPDHYYRPHTYGPSTGKLQEFLNLFKVESEIDRDLIKAMLMTLLWGGSLGKRPMFVVTGEGRGTGKSTLAMRAAEIFGGYIDVSRSEGIEKIKQRLLANESMSRRVCLLDNVKGVKTSWAELEGLITSKVISGHKMYAGETQRPNNVTWMMTINEASFSADLATRSIEIKLRRPTDKEKFDGWEWKVDNLMTHHQQSIRGDLIREFDTEPMNPTNRTRWGNWDEEVLGRFKNAEEIIGVINERCKKLDADAEDADILLTYINQLIDRSGHSGKTIFLTSTEVHEHFCNAFGERKKTVKAVTQLLKQWISEGRLEGVEFVRKRIARGFLILGDTNDHFNLLGVKT